MFGDTKYALKARYVFPVTSPPIRDGIVTIDGELIAAVGENTSGKPPHDLGNAAILPGLVNAHTHLEFSELETPLGQPGTPFPDWIHEVVAYRRAREAAAADRNSARSELNAIISRGLSESEAAGVTSLGEIATTGWLGEDSQNTSIDCTVFHEVIALGADQIDSSADFASHWLQLAQQDKSAWRPGLSPHAPYSVHPALVTALARLSKLTEVPVAMHLAESMEELELLSSQSGPFVELLNEFDAWDPSAIPRGIRPLDYLNSLAKAHRALVIHGNFLIDNEIAFLAERADHMSVVYCPRTHSYFQHGRYPLNELIAAGVNVALGTDSRASNPDLSVFEELRFVTQHHSDVAPADVLRMGTIAGAKAFGIDRITGSLEQGKRADLACVRFAEKDASDDPYRLLFESSDGKVMTICRGKSVQLET